MAAVPGITDAGLFSSDFLITCVDLSQFMAARSHDRRTLCFANVYLFVYFFLEATSRRCFNAFLSNL